MKDLAPDILRQRLLIEGYYNIEVDRETIADYFTTITSKLNLRAYGEPIIFLTGGEGKEENQGFDAFVPLIDSGISVYVWVHKKFFSGILYTCKSFDEKTAIAATRKYFKMKETESFSF